MWKSKIKPGLPFMVLHLVHKFRMICLSYNCFYLYLDSFFYFKISLNLTAVSNILITIFEPCKRCFFCYISFQVNFKSNIRKSLENCRCIWITSFTVSKIDTGYMKFCIVQNKYFSWIYFVVLSILSNNKVRVVVFNAILKQYFSYFVVVSFIGGGNRRAWRKPRPVASHWQT
jgi:hypothetical protein